MVEHLRHESGIGCVVLESSAMIDHLNNYLHGRNRVHTVDISLKGKLMSSIHSKGLVECILFFSMKRKCRSGTRRECVSMSTSMLFALSSGVPVRDS
jgi:hypothetical protein